MGSPLLPQTGGFEGFLAIAKKLDADNLAVAEGPNLAVRTPIQLDAADTSAHVLTEDRDDAVSGVDELLVLEAGSLPCRVPSPPEGSDAVVAEVDAIELRGAGKHRREVPFDLRVVLGEHGLRVSA